MCSLEPVCSIPHDPCRLHSRAMVGAWCLGVLGAVEIDFNSGWMFARGDGSYMSLNWKAGETPHDWTIEDLPSREDDDVTPVLAVRQGSWRFAEGEGDRSWAANNYDDSSWKHVSVPADWHDYGYTTSNATGWFRSNFSVAAAQLAAASAGTLRLALGDVAVADRTYVNGVLVGHTGDFGQPGSCSGVLLYRSYPVDEKVLHVGGDNVIAVQVWSEGGPLARGDKSFTFHAHQVLGAGNDILPPANTTVGVALARCNTTLECVGETFESNASEPLGSRAPVKAYFKSSDGFFEDDSWQTFVSPRGRPGGLYDWGAPDMRVGPFDPGASPGQKQTGYTLGGVGWYMKTFSVDADWGDHLELFIEGCYMNCSFYLNSVHLLTHPYGYTSFAIDLSGSKAFDRQQPNVLTVRVESRGLNSRWYASRLLHASESASSMACLRASLMAFLIRYAGAGLFRPVTLLSSMYDLHLVPVSAGGVYVTTPVVNLTNAAGTRTDALVHINVTIANAGNASSGVLGLARGNPLGLEADVIDDETGAIVGSADAQVPAIGAGADASVLLSIFVRGGRTWSPDQPALYRAVVRLNNGDSEVAIFGLRTFAFESMRGFVLNGQPLKMLGGCVHHDNGPLGSKAIGRAEERRVELLKGNGYNTIRTSHNPVSRAFVEACNRLGVMLMEEAFDCWDTGKNLNDYHVFFDDWWQRCAHCH